MKGIILIKLLLWRDNIKLYKGRMQINNPDKETKSENMVVVNQYLINK